MLKFTTKELSKKTWPDFERLFSQGNGWDHCWCTAYQRATSGGTTTIGRDVQERPRNRAGWSAVNRKDKQDLVERGRAHGILVYAGTEPIGWCQFGPEEELPLEENLPTSEFHQQLDQVSSRSPNDSSERLWKITCFVTHKQYQRKGVAETSLRAALEAIRKKGGGRVEAYPYALISEPPPPDPTWQELIRKHGPRSPEVKQNIVRRDGQITYYAGKAFLRHDLVIEGAGPVNAVYWRGMGMFHAGTVAMFEQAGFKAVGVVPSPPTVKSPWLVASRVVMQKKLKAAAR